MRRDLRTRMTAVAIVALVLAACGPGDGAVTETQVAGTAPADPPASTPRASTAETDDGPSEGLDRTSPTGGTSLQRTGVETATSLERRVAETLSRLEATARDGDTIVTLPDTVLFDFDRAELRPEAAGVLDSLVEVMAFYDSAPIRVEGHTDSVGTNDYNQGLSERRATAVASYLLDQAVDPDRVTAEGFGASRPVAPNAHSNGADNPAGRAANRRVEIILVGVDHVEPAG